ncbi:hypothetical protein KI811_11630 [Geobacter hydrogenophilus]|uniref:Uncharacterized protein n=1 Tax=Geobacter hydrogenophilus TaxID=40983 RepID=A0A9W6G2S4_9BACT|nr:hypothetical protein [Geobacter hydrogenophilus]MBT0894459.1 hypothetical protein [Geobacter hydrogenophilus]GLI39386.1 hypothetical protein GHYDROH2_28870 [Geobacter hydrogenophilus]
MKLAIVAGMVLLPHVLFAETDCRIDEYPDHYVAICNGEEKAEPQASQSSASDQSAAATPGTSIQTAIQDHSTDSVNGSRLGRMSKSRIEAAVIARNRLLQENE